MRPAKSAAVAAILLAGAVVLSIPVCLAAETAASSPVALPRGAAGIGFDDLRFAPSLGVVLVPAGRTGFLDLVDPATGAVTSIPGFSKIGTHRGGHGPGVTSADEGASQIFATDRTSGDVLVVDPKNRRILSRTKLAGPPDYVRFVPATRELWVTEPIATESRSSAWEQNPFPRRCPSGSYRSKVDRSRS